MGGKLERIEIHALSDARNSAADGRRSLDGLKAQFATFDAAKAQCFLPQDKHRLLAVVEAGFGDFEDFNMRVRTAFAERLDAPSRQTTKTNLIVAATLQSSAGQVELAPEGEEEPNEVQQEYVQQEGVSFSVC